MNWLTASVFIEPHERHEAVEAYKDRLTPEQVDEIDDAPDEAIIQLKFGAAGTQIVVIEEG
jgi:predicted ribosome quality control (RQC) complex YloA/Tae2 family protein